MASLSLRSLKLRDYRCFESIDIDFHDHMTVFVAANGAGKTSILDAIAVALGPYVGAFDEAVGKHFESSDIRQYQVRKTVTHEMEYAAKGVRLEASGFIPGSILESIGSNAPPTWRRVLSGPTKAKTTIKDAKELINYAKRMQEAARTPGNAEILPLVAYYGTGRLWQQKKLTETKKKIEKTSRTVAYTDCLDPASSYKSFIEWFRYWNSNAKNAKLKALETGQHPVDTEFDGYIKSVASAVNICLSPVGWRDIDYSFTRETLVARHDELGELPVELLSDGIRNMIGMVADIAFRATKLNGHLGEKAATLTPGVVLIDEIDMHLHPEWQQVVAQSLMRAFPAMQFIVTTHSPQVLSTVDHLCIRMLTQDIYSDTQAPQTVVRNVELQTLGVASSDLLARIMGVNPIPDVEQAHDLSHYHALIQQNRHDEPEAQHLRDGLEAHFGSLHPVMLECDRMIRLQDFKQRLPTNPNRQDR